MGAATGKVASSGGGAAAVTLRCSVATGGRWQMGEARRTRRGVRAPGVPGAGLGLWPGRGAGGVASARACDCARDWRGERGEPFVRGRAGSGGCCELGAEAWGCLVPFDQEGGCAAVHAVGGWRS